MSNFTKPIAKKIYSILIDNWDNVIDNLSEKSILDILESIWELSSDDKSEGNFSNFRMQILKFYLNEGWSQNAKKEIQGREIWSTNHLFIKKLNVFDNQFDFFKFINILLNPLLFNSQDDLERIVYELNYELEETEFNITLMDFDDDLLIYEIIKRGLETDIPSGIETSNIPFYNGYPETSTNDSEYFILVPNKNWNDYNVVSIFQIYYYKNGYRANLGSTKIIHRKEMITWTRLPDKFIALDTNFCSLSSDEDFYLNLKQEFGLSKTVSILYALKDAAYFVNIHETFSNNSNFKKSLIRSDEGERLIRQLRPILHGLNLSELYNFSYSFRPAYANDPTRVTLEFSNKEPLPDRIFAIIGKNGTGKTQLLASLPEKLNEGNPDIFFKKVPDFSKIIAISYSAFDYFKPQKNTAKFNYVYCGLRNQEGLELSVNDKTIEFYNNLNKIIQHDRVRKWRAVLKTFIDKEIVLGLISKNDKNEYVVVKKWYQEVRRKLSSGQSILLSIMTQVIANIRYDSLILYDEPETHLHPNAITELMNTIYELVDEFESYCLIATHSPLVIRELFSKNVFIMERHDDVPSLKRIGIESFGENLGVLTEEVFGDKSADKKHKRIISDLVRRGHSYNDIIQLIQFDEVPLSLNAKIYIKMLTDR